MAVRTDATAVQGIIDLADANDDLTPFIESAALVVDRIAALDSPPGSAELELVERWLAAHYYAVYRQQPDTEKAGPVSEKKQFYVSHGLQTTMWGTQAMTLDSSGTLADINAVATRKDPGKFKGSITFLGSNANLHKEDRL